MHAIATQEPLPGVLFGITHHIDGSLLIREPRILKVGIGLPRGRALNVWIHNDKRWYFRIGVKGSDGKLKFETVHKAGLATRAEAQRFYRENYAKAEPCNYPRKLGFFTFTRPVIGEDGTEVFEPDFEAIEAHGPAPTEIDIVFLDDNPFSGAYQMWSTSELRCKGDGVNAQRVFSMAATDEEKRLVQEAKNAGKKYFPIIGGCWTNGCPYSKEGVDDRGRPQPSPCKPGGDLKFQLARNIRVGGTAYFHTSGYRSISHIFSSIERIKTLTGGRLAGIPLKMVLRPYRTKHNGQSATQYGVSLEFRAEDIESLRKNLMEQAFRFRQVLEPGPARRLLDAPAEPVTEEEEEEELPINAQAMTDEFYADAGDTAEEEPAAAKPVNTAAAATEAKTSDLAEKLKAQTKRKAPAESYAPPAPPPAAAPKPASEPQDGDLF
jgi:hypothetical protein